jgi:hypothetical protein
MTDAKADAKSRNIEFATDRRKVDKNRLCASETQSREISSLRQTGAKSIKTEFATGARIPILRIGFAPLRGQGCVGWAKRCPPTPTPSLPEGSGKLELNVNYFNYSF